MNLLLLTDGVYPYLMGGMQRHSFMLLKYLLLGGNKLTLVHYKPDQTKEPPFNELNELKGVPLSNFKEIIVPFRKTDPFPGHYIRENKAYSKRAFETIKDSLKQFDAIYAQGFSGYAFLNNPVHIPVFVNLHGYEMFQPAASIKARLEALLLRNIAKKLSIEADFVFSFGSGFSKMLRKLGVRKGRELVCPHGIEETWLLNEIRKTTSILRTFVFVGRYERRKGIEEYHAAIERLTEEDLQKAAFHFVGPVPEEVQLKRSNCYYHGSVSPASKLMELLDKMDVLVCPSHSEGLPTVIMEAMARGLAIIATDVGAVEQLMHDNGWLLKRSDPKLIAQALHSAIYSDQERLNTMKQHSLKHVSNHFIWRKVIEKKIELIRRAIES